MVVVLLVPILIEIKAYSRTAASQFVLKPKSISSPSTSAQRCQMVRRWGIMREWGGDLGFTA